MGYGLAKILAKHPEVVADLPDIIKSMLIVSRSSNRLRLENASHSAGVRLEWDGAAKSWVVTAFERDRSKSGRQLASDDQLPASGSPPAGGILPQAAAKVEPFEPAQHGDAQTQALERALAGSDDMMIPVSISGTGYLRKCRNKPKS